MIVRSRTLRAYLRDVRLLIRQFRFTLLAFAFLLLVGTFVLRYTYTPGQPLGWLAAMDMALGLMFFEMGWEYPTTLPAQIVHLLWPILGLALVVNGVVEFWIALFNRRERREIWEVALASTYRNHIVVCGLGKVGSRAAFHLLRMGYDVVGVEMNPQAPFLEVVRQRKIPVIMGNARHPDVLEKAGVRSALAVIAATEDDMTNLGIALEARVLNPDIRVVLRMFDPQIADDIQRSFGFVAYSTSALAAPVLAIAATRAAVEYSFYLNDVLLNISRLTVNPDSALVGKRVGEVEQELDLSIILHSTADSVDFHPSPDRVLAAGDCLVVLAPLEALSHLHRLNASACPVPQGREGTSWLDRLRGRFSPPGRGGP